MVGGTVVALRVGAGVGRVDGAALGVASGLPVAGETPVLAPMAVEPVEEPWLEVEHPASKPAASAAAASCRLTRNRGRWRGEGDETTGNAVSLRQPGVSQIEVTDCSVVALVPMYTL